MAKKALTDAIAFDEAVKVAKDMTGEDTLLVVTADHSHVFNIAGYPKRGNNILGLVDPQRATADGMPYATLVYANGEPPGGRINLTNVDTTADDHKQARLVPIDGTETETHGGENRDVTKVKKRQLRKTAAKYTIREDVLYHDGILVAKRNQVPEILQEFHDNYVSGGHLGMNKTYKKVLERYFWHGMKQEVEDYCRSCCVCQNMNACRKKPAAPLHPIPVPKKKWSLVGMDIIGPLQVTDRGNQYIVALTDHFTKSPVAKAIPCKSSEEVARFMYETICIFGAFDSLITDQGREFINFALDILTDRFNINHRISSAYHPETNGQRERDNRTLKDTLVKITDNDDWDELLPAALFAYRTSVHKSTQFSPFLALYGEQAKLPFDVTGDANEQDLNEEIMDTMKGIHEEVKNKIGENISRAQKKQKEYYDSRRAYDHGFRIGDKVLIINAARVHRMGGKMAPRFVGPYETYNTDKQVPDSAGTGTAFLAGVKANYGTLGVDERVRRQNCSFFPEGKVTTILDWSLAAASYAHTPERDWESDLAMETAPEECKVKVKDIAAQLVEDSPNNDIKVWLTDKMRRGANAKYVSDRQQLQNVDPADTDFLLGLFSQDHMAYDLNRNDTGAIVEPSLSEMVAKAIGVLSKDTVGFFLLVEGGRIDHAHHLNFAKLALVTHIESENVFLNFCALYQVSTIMIIIIINIVVVVVIIIVIIIICSFPTKHFQQSRLVPTRYETHAGEDVAIYATGPMAHLFHGVHEQNYIAHVMAYASCVGALSSCEKEGVP
nr:hypothetical protein BaRGS_017964 [Batillaria attramentaria]